MRASRQPCLLACLLAPSLPAVSVSSSSLCLGVQRDITSQTDIILTEYCEEPAVLLHWVVSRVLAAEESVREIGDRGSHRYLLQDDRAQMPYASSITHLPELLQGRGCDSNG